MSLANMKELIRQARTRGHAVGAFSVSSIEMIQGVIRAAEAASNAAVRTAAVRLNDSSEQTRP